MCSSSDWRRVRSATLKYFTQQYDFQFRQPVQRAVFPRNVGEYGAAGGPVWRRGCFQLLSESLIN